MATVEVHRLTYWGSNDEFLLKGVSCVARPGELLGILGGSGTGKRYGGSCVPLRGKSARTQVTHIAFT